MAKHTDIFLETRDLIREVGKKYNFPEDKLDAFIHPNRIIESALPLKRKGKVEIYRAFRSQHNNKLGPYKGGIRFHEDVSRDEAMTLSIWMSLKTALVGLPFGGGKGGVKVNPKELTEKELEELSREYVRKFFDVIGPDKDIPAPDVNTNPKILNWMVDEYVKIGKENKLSFSKEALYGAFTGKSIDKFGLDGREEATGYGGAIILHEIAKKLDKKPEDTTVAIQGFGNVGYYFAKFASELGFKIVALSDSKGGVTDRKEELNGNLDIDNVFNCKLEKGVVSGCYCVGGVCDINAGKTLSNEELLELPVDVIVPSALGNVITEDNMKNIKANIIIEMANGPLSSKAHKYLSEKGRVIVPDILANAAGVSASYLEWLQNIESKRFTKKEVLDNLKDIMSKALKKVWKESEDKEIDLRTASYGIALKKLI